jgi:hypothetical protein
VSFLKKVKEIGGDLADTTKRVSLRGKLEIEVRRIEGRIDDEKNGIGHDLFPEIEAGTLAVENASVKERLARIADLQAELAAKRAEMEALKEGDDDTAEAGAKEEAPV